MNFEDKTVLITGGSAGIGRATALRFAELGARVFIADKDAAEGEQTLNDLLATGAEAYFTVTDVTSSASVESMVRDCVSQFGGIDCAINNAGVELEWAPIADGNETHFDEIMAVNVKGVWLCLREEIREMQKLGLGTIVNIASIAALKAAPNMSAYSASKHAVIGLTKTAAMEYAKFGIRVNVVCPGVISTSMTDRAKVKIGDDSGDRLSSMHPLGRIGTADEVAAAALWLSSDNSSFTTGSVLSVDGGLNAQ